MKNSRIFVSTFMLCGAFIAIVTDVRPADAPLPKESPAAFRKGVEPFLKQYCLSCHQPPKPESNLDLTKLDWDLVNGPDGETWHDILNRLNRGEMPPAKAKQPGEDAHQAVVRLIDAELKRLVAARGATGGRVVLRRLTRYEYNNTMRDLLGIDMDFARDLPPEPASKDGFRNNGSSLGMSPLQLETYLEAARAALAKTIVTGPQPKVYRSHAEKSAKKSGKNQVASNNLGPSGVFLAVASDFPRSGEVLVRVRAGAHVPEGAGYPRLRVSLGVRADTLASSRTLGEADVVDPIATPGTYEFRGRIEDFPLPGANPKFPGLLVTVENIYAEGTSAAPANGKNKGKAAPAPAAAQPSIEVKSVDFEGPLYEQWPPAHHTRILFPSDHVKDEKAYAREVLARFIGRAWRRPATDAEIALHLTLFDKVRPKFASFEEAMRETLAMVLTAPEFLYLVEARAENSKKLPLTDYELAARLSYFLWSTMPDETLFRLAATGELRDPDVFARQVRRMVADKGSWEFVRHFADQWLDLGSLERVAVNPEYYPNFDDRLKVEMRRETEHFFAEILHKDLSALNLIESDFAMLNRPLARHYGIPGPKGLAFERVPLRPEHNRGGLLTHGSILLGNSTGEDSHAIRRAVWLRDRLLNDPPAPPPPDVPDLKKNEPNLAALPLRKQLEVHRTKSACNACHRGIDPWGIAFENYDAVGLWRDEVKRVLSKKVTLTPVESETTLPDGTRLDGLAGLKKHMLGRERDRFARAVVVKVLTYALGRSLELTDEPAVAHLTKEFTSGGYRLGDLILAVARSEPFRTK